MPRSRGGKTEWNNVVTSCTACNLRKGNRTPQEAGMRMAIAPHRPSRRVKIALVLNPGVPVPRTWQRFIDTLYWNTELEA